MSDYRLEVPIVEDERTVRAVMRAPFEEFEQFGKVHDAGATKWKPTQRHIYIDNGGDVLAIAHLDSVQRYNGVTLQDDKLSCGTLDNRLGAYLILYALPRFGCKYDILLTENEESGQSTAINFTPSKQYNWMFSFDRGGSDVVAYQYYSNELKGRVARHDMTLGHGSYSDIADAYVGCKGLNWGCGMMSYHSAGAYTSLPTLNRLVTNFVGFYQEFCDTPMPHDPKDDYAASYYVSYAGKYNTYGSYRDWEDDYHLWNQPRSSLITTKPTYKGKNIYWDAQTSDFVTVSWDEALQCLVTEVVDVSNVPVASSPPNLADHFSDRVRIERDAEASQSISQWWMDHANPDPDPVEEADYIPCCYCEHFFDPLDTVVNDFFNARLCKSCDAMITRGEYV